MERKFIYYFIIFSEIISVFILLSIYVIQKNNISLIVQINQISSFWVSFIILGAILSYSSQIILLTVIIKTYSNFNLMKSKSYAIDMGMYYFGLFFTPLFYIILWSLDHSIDTIFALFSNRFGDIYLSIFFNESDFFLLMPLLPLTQVILVVINWISPIEDEYEDEL